MAVPTSYAVVLVAKQTLKGTPVTTPCIAHALTGGSIITLELENSTAETTSGSRFKSIGWRESATPGVELEALAQPKSLGMYLLGILGAETKSGENAPYRHTFTPGAGQPYLTVAGKFIDPTTPEELNVSDVRLSELELSWDGNEPLAMKASGTGCAITPYNATIGDITNDETTSDSHFSPVAGTFKFSGSGEAASAVVTAGSVKIASDVEAVHVSGELLPVDAYPKVLTVEFGLTLVIDDFNSWRKILTTTDTGTTLEEDPVSGAVELLFKNPAVATDDLTIKSTGVRWAADLPDFSPGGDTAVLELSGEAIAAAAADVITVELNNSVSSTY